MHMIRPQFSLQHAIKSKDPSDCMHSAAGQLSRLICAGFI